MKLTNWASPPDRASLIVIVALLALAGGWMVWLGAPAFPLDDAYIVQHAASGLLQGEETRYVDSTPLQGATSRWHVLLVALFGMALPLPFAQAMVAAIIGFIYLLGAWVLARRAQLPLAQSYALVVLAGLAGCTLYQLFNGLETGLAMAALVWTFVAFDQPRPQRSAWWLVVGALPFIRPELGLWSALLFVRAVFDGDPLNLNKNNMKAQAAFAIRAGVIAALAVIPIMLLLFWQGESATPNTVSGKEAFFAEGCRTLIERVVILSDVLVRSSGAIGVILLAPFVIVGSRMKWISWTFMGVFLLVYTLKFPGGLSHNSFRYLHVFAPFLLFGLVELLRGPDRSHRMAGNVLLIATLLISVLSTPGAWRSYEKALDNSRVRNLLAVEWVAENVPDTATILIHDAGMISLHGRQKLVDIVGLKTPASVAIHRDTTFATCTRDSRAIDRIARRYNATHMVSTRNWDAIFGLSQGLTDEGWTVTRIDGERGDTVHRVFALTPPQADAQPPQ